MPSKNSLVATCLFAAGLDIGLMVGFVGQACTPQETQVVGEGESILVGDALCVVQALAQGKDPKTVCVPQLPTSQRIKATLAFCDKMADLTPRDGGTRDAR